jgi:hypothetical protein
MTAWVARANQCLLLACIGVVLFWALSTSPHTQSGSYRIQLAGETTDTRANKAHAEESKPNEAADKGGAEGSAELAALRRKLRQVEKLYDDLKKSKSSISSSTASKTPPSYQESVGKTAEKTAPAAKDLGEVRLIPSTDHHVAKEFITESKVIYNVTTSSVWRTPSHVPHIYNNQPCPFDNMDIFIPFTGRREIITLTYLFKSILAFVPCYRQLHLFVPNEDDYRAILSSVPAALTNVLIHLEAAPPVVPKLMRLRMQWGQFWADNYTTAEWVMFVDSDSLFTHPLTCQAVFDNHGRSYMMYYDGWDVFNDTFVNLLTNNGYRGDFMASMPM